MKNVEIRTHGWWMRSANATSLQPCLSPPSVITFLSCPDLTLRMMHTPSTSVMWSLLELWFLSWVQWSFWTFANHLSHSFSGSWYLNSEHHPWTPGPSSLHRQRLHPLHAWQRGLRLLRSSLRSPGNVEPPELRAVPPRRAETPEARRSGSLPGPRRRFRELERHLPVSEDDVRHVDVERGSREREGDLDRRVHRSGQGDLRKVRKLFLTG